MTKAELRERAQTNRSSLRVDHGRICAGLEHFLAGLTLVSSQRRWVVTFAAMPGEPDLAGLVDRPNIGSLALTRTPEEGRVLSVHPADAERELHRWGYSQPVSGAPIVPDADIAVVLVPGLAFDRQGGRLGFGAGFYDRFLSRLGPDVMRVGVSDGFIVAEVPTDDHDVAMTHLATEAGVMALPLDGKHE